VDHNCSKATIFIPCKEPIGAEEMAALYAQYMFLHFGILMKVISDQDMQFMVTFTKELWKVLDIMQNISTAYHPQTNEQLEQANQWLEQYLQIYGNAQHIRKNQLFLLHLISLILRVRKE